MTMHPDTNDAINAEPTPEQLKNFRNGLQYVIGAYALLMSEDDLLKMHKALCVMVQREGNTPDVKYKEGDTVWIDGKRKAIVKQVHPYKTFVRWPYGGNDTFDHDRVKLEKT